MFKPSIGFVGLGAIGLPIASNLLKAGFVLKVHSRSRQAEEDQRLSGAISCDSPKDVAKDCDVLFICVSDDQAVEKVLFSQKGAFLKLKQKSIVIDLSTISPSSSRTIASKLATKDIEYIDAPVSGGTEGATLGTLTMFLGCHADRLNQIASFLEPIAKNIFCFGEPGKGQEVKAINQILIAGTYSAVAEALALGQKLDLPMNNVVEALETGAAGSWALSHRSKGMLIDCYPLGFKLSLHYKDLSIALKTAAEIGIELPITTMVRDIEKYLISQGYGDDDVSVLRRSIKTTS